MSKDSIPSIFEHVILTAPNEKVANVYRTQLTILKQNHPDIFHGTTLHCVSDPQGRRIGSGGGTIHAVQSIDISHEQLLASRILIIHSGGDSRRIPLYSLIGKAWINFQDNNNNISNPFLLLVQELSTFFTNLPEGSLIVACSDVLLQLVNNGRNCIPPSIDDGTYIVTVRADLSTAKNHGVICPSDVIYSSDDASSLYLNHARDYLQKPSITEMQDKQAVLHNEQAMIDTGVVCFIGQHTLNTFLQITTQPQFIYVLPNENNTVNPNAVRIELYSEILYACKLLQQNDTFDSYLLKNKIKRASSVDSNYLDGLQSIFTIMQQTTLRYIHVNDGKFIHLGTTKEVLQFNQILQESGLYHRTHSLLYSLSITTDDDEVNADSSDTSCNSIIECSMVPDYVLRLIHQSCLSYMDSIISHHVFSILSPFRNTCLDGTLLQQVFLSNTLLPNTINNALSRTLIYFHIDDDIKGLYTSPTSTIYGLTWQRIFQDLDVQPGDIWDVSTCNDNTIWNAKLFVVFTLDDQQRPLAINVKDQSIAPVTWESILLFPHCKTAGSPSVTEQHLTSWKSSHRVSLADILTCGDAETMLLWKLWMQLLTSSSANAAYTTLKSSQYIISTFTKLMEIRNYIHSSIVTHHYTSIDLLSIIFFVVFNVMNLQSLTTDSEEEKQTVQFLLDVLRLPTDTTSVLQGILSKMKDFILEHIHNSLQGPWELIPCMVYIQRLLQLSHPTNKMLLVVQILLRYSKRYYTVIAIPRLLLFISWLLTDHNRANETNTVFVDKEQYLTLIDLTTTILATITTVNDISSTEVYGGILDGLFSTIQGILDTNIAGITTDKGCLFIDLIETIMQKVVEASIRSSLHHQLADLSPLTTSSKPRDVAFINMSSAAVRIDISGGWSDTPPICYEHGGSVLNVAVRVDGRRPVRCISRFITQPIILLRAMKRADNTNDRKLDVLGEEQCVDWTDFDKLSHNDSPCALMKACLVALKIIPILDTTIRSQLTLLEYLQRFVGIEGNTIMGLEVVTLSDLPAGSGMGGSSILAASILHSLATTLLPSATTNSCSISNSQLVSLVSQVEQLLTTGGGWQDQIGSIYPGLKIGRSRSSTLPLEVQIEEFPVATSDKVGLNKMFVDALDTRLYLVYTGQQRLAKNTLICALRSYAATYNNNHNNGDRLSTATKLVVETERSVRDIFSQAAGTHLDLDKAHELVDQLGVVLSRYWELKVEMAASSNPPHIQALLSRFCAMSAGLSLCGAGAGGFAAIILKRQYDMVDLEKLVNTINCENTLDRITLHQASIDYEGITSTQIPMLNDINSDGDEVIQKLLLL